MSSPGRSSADHLSTTIPVIKQASSSSSSSQTSAFSVQLAFVSVVPEGPGRGSSSLQGRTKAPVFAAQGGMMSAWRPGCSSHSLTPVIYACFPPLDTSAAHTHADSSRLAVWERCLSVQKHEAWLSEATEGGKLHPDIHWMDFHAGQRHDRWLTQESAGNFANLRGGN